MEKRKRCDQIRASLRNRYPDVRTQLDFNTPFELLAATILSAQCTDKQVNQVTEKLFQKMRTPADFVRADREELEALIRPTGYYRNKAKSLQQCAHALVERHDQTVPANLEALVKLPGVGRKTANVVLGAAFGIPGVVVDTHVSRISRRLGLTPHKDAVKIEYDLMALVPKDEWNAFSLHLIYFGREICTARKPKCPICPIEHLCPYPEKTAK